MTKTAALLCAVLACAAAPSFAAGEAGPGPCKADYEKFCKDVKPGEGRIAKCLKEHDADLSPECKAKRAEVKEKMQQAKADFDKSCGGDVKSLCADVKAGHGAILRCLKSHKEKVSDGCKDFMKEKKEQRQERRKKRMERRQGAQSGGSSDDSGGKSDDSGSQD